MVASMVRLDGLVKSQVSGQAQKVDFRVMSIWKWPTSRLARHCAREDCDQTPTSGGLCLNRSGLIGRSFLLETRIKLGLVPDGNRILTELD